MIFKVTHNRHSGSRPGNTNLFLHRESSKIAFMGRSQILNDINVVASLLSQPCRQAIAGYRPQFVHCHEHVKCTFVAEKYILDAHAHWAVASYLC